MKTYIQRAIQVLLIASAWFISGYVFTGGISVGFLKGPFFSPLSFQGAFVNMIVSLVIIIIITATPRGFKYFYEGTEPGSGANLLIWAVIALPIPCTLIGILWLVLGYLGRWLGLWKM